jgi:hypothetical protein
MRTLNDLMQFDHVVRVHPDGTVTDDVPDVWAPDLLMDTDGDGSILDEHEKDYTEQAQRQGWRLLTGWTGQDRYNGCIMHASEYVGGGLETHIRENPGLYVCITVKCLPTSEDGETECAGWAIAYRAEETEGE